MISIAFYFILTGVYKVGVYLYNVLISLAVEGTDIFNINPVVENAYILVGTFMVFRIIITLLQMVIDPDKVSDKQAGAGKMLSRIVVCFLLLISFNTIYNFMIDKIQPAVIGPDGFITNFVKVNYTTEPINPNDKKASRYENLQPGYVVVGSVFSSLLDLNTKFVSFTKSLVSSAVMPAPTKLVSLIANNVVDEKVCREAKDNEKGYKYDNYSELKKENSSLLYYPGLAGGAILYMGSVNFYVGYVCALGEMYDLNFVINLIIGLALVVFIFVMCIEIVVRDLKIIVLRVIAPIAFICYLNPKDKIFNQWLKSFASVYFDLFLKLFSISLATTIITASSDKLTQKHIGVILILGILTFAKLLPSFISKIFGISGSGSFKESFNMAKKGFGLATAGVAAAAVGGVSRGYAAASNIQKGEKGRNWAIAKASLSGGLSAGFSGAKDGWKGKGASSAISTAKSKSRAYGDLLGAGVSPKFKDMFKNRAAATFGIATEGEKLKAQLEHIDEVAKAQDDLMATGKKEAGKSQTTQTTITGKNLGKTRATSRKFTVDELQQLQAEGVAKVKINGVETNINDAITAASKNGSVELQSMALTANFNQLTSNIADARAKGSDTVDVNMQFGVDSNNNGVNSNVSLNISDAESSIELLEKQATVDLINSGTNEVVNAKKKRLDDLIKNDTSGLFSSDNLASIIELDFKDDTWKAGANGQWYVDAYVNADGEKIYPSVENGAIVYRDNNGKLLSSADLSKAGYTMKATNIDKDWLQKQLNNDASLYSKLGDDVVLHRDITKNSAEFIAAQKMDEYRNKTKNN